MNFYYFSICHLCKRSSDSLKKCSHCRVPFYCSRAHQLLDWPNHKNLCKAITNTNKFRSIAPGCSAVDFNQFKYTNSLLWRYEVGRELEFAEQQMWMFPKVCSVCFSFEAEIVCEICTSVAYCCEEHQNSHKEEHAKSCPTLKMCLLVYQTLCTEELTVDWVKFKINREATGQGENLEQTIKHMGFTNPHDFSKKQVDYIIMTEYFCPALNLIYPLEKTRFIERRQAKKPTVVMHVVGPSTNENKMSWILIVEYLSHWVFNLKAAKVFLIGPEVNKEETATITLKCAECKAKNFVGTVVKIKGLYHDHVNYIPRPDLIVCFNSGLHEFMDSKGDTWKKSIPKLVGFRGVPTMLTAYTETELKKDVGRFKESHINYIVTPQRNPFSSLRPNRNWEEGSEPVFYQSGYVAIVTKK
ncbi:hypothetical protein Zmor_013139 [Zophobas morio]|uniref:MYND-type domain-containing protein n=1 Tax=Zophobas morio TaxID=2755281 RepID=A0AA38IF69_9CUCU|nr:hypothetical protein Zmor_013139 [Zophobas morio]